MSLTEFQISDITLKIETPPSVSLQSGIDPEVIVQVDKLLSVDLVSVTGPEVVVIAAGNVGPPGPTGKWEALTQNEYDLLNPPDPETLYVIIQ